MLSGTWDATTQVADLAWDPITEESVSSLQIRATSGPDDEVDDESVVATLPANAPAAWTGNWGLTAPGSSVTFKLCSLTDQGNERDSNAVTVTRPVV